MALLICPDCPMGLELSIIAHLKPCSYSFASLAVSLTLYKSQTYELKLSKIFHTKEYLTENISSERKIN